MTIMASPVTEVIGGIDTHQDTHTAVAVDTSGRPLGCRSFATTREGYRALLEWLRSLGKLLRVGVESTGSYGAGVARYLAAEDIQVLEVTGPDRGKRRRQGKDDRLDAEAAAQAALTGVRTQVAKQRDGAVEALRMLRTTRGSASKAKRATLQLLHSTLVAAPDPLRDRLRNLSPARKLRACAALRPGRDVRDPTTATKIALRTLAQRILDLAAEIVQLDRLITPLVAELAPEMLELTGFGPANAGTLLVTAGDNPERLLSEASFAMLCGASPIPASSGKTTRHRLNRGGNRQANSALHMVVVTRMRSDPRTKLYVSRRLEQGKSKREVMRCLKRYVAREVYKILVPRPS